MIGSRDAVTEARPGQVGSGLVATSPCMQRLLQQAEMAARGTDKSILITGEIGVGKSHLAQFIHNNSARSTGSLITLDCGSFSDLDNILYGHRRGAFTGAVREFSGRLQEADHGTLVLDDVDRLTPHQQDQLHRVLVNGVFYPMGAAHTVTVDIRFLATTNKDPDRLFDEGTLQPDFLSRLDYFSLRVPPLCERPEDVPPLGEALLERNLKELVDKHIRPSGQVQFDPDCWPAIQARRFPDNVRGLDKLVARALVHISARTCIVPADIDVVYPVVQRSNSTGQSITLQMVREAAERDHIRKVCESTGHNYRRVARILDISPKALYDKLRRYGIQRPA